MHYRYWATLLVIFLMASASVQAEGWSATALAGDIRLVHEKGTLVYGLAIDNDSLLLQDRDGFYSSGVRISANHRLRSGNRLLSNSWHIGQEIYTPSDIKLPPERVGPPDHPYAAWLYTGFYHRVHRADGSVYGIGVDIGCLGACAGGEWTQKQLHRLINQPQPQGWSRQVRDEVGAVLNADIGTPRWQPRPWLDMVLRAYGRFGNIFTDAGTMAIARAGRLNDLPDGTTLHTFARAERRLVGYHAPLQGGYFSSGNPHTMSPTRGVLEGEMGIVWNRPPFETSVSVLRRGSEIRGVPHSSGAQNFARLRFSYALQ